MPITFCENCESTECRCEGGVVNFTPSPEHFEIMRGALDHIARTARRSRTSTRRLRWIEVRAEMAIKGQIYRDEDVDLPKDGGPATASKLQQKIQSLRSDKADLLEALRRLSAQAARLRFPWQAETDAEKNAKAAIARATTVPNEANHE